MDFVLIERVDQQDPEYAKMLDRCRSNARAHCPICGRFARHLGGQWVYLGYGSEYRTTVSCKVDGLQEVY